MATSAKRPKARPASKQTPAALLRDAGKKPAPVYLLSGEQEQCEALARKLIDVLVPPERRSVNLETYEGRSTALSNVLDSCRTLGLFGGGKVVWMREPAFFASTEKKPEITEALLAAWSADRRKPAAEKLLLLAALAGWQQEDLETTAFAELAKTKAKAFLGREMTGEDPVILDAIRMHAIESGMTVASQKDEGALLEDYLNSGTGGDAVLIFTSSAADRRKRVFKLIEKLGAVFEIKIDRERSGAMTKEAVDRLIDETLANHDKTMSSTARQLVVKQAGPDPGPLQVELEKLCLYIGEAPAIDDKDVHVMMRDLGESWIFDFTRALAQRNVSEAILLLRGLIAQGEPPLRLLAMITREVRILMAAREILSTSLARAWTDRTTFQTFRDQMLPQIPEEQKKAVGGMHPFVLYLAMQNASRTTTARLRTAVLELHELDIAFKSSRADPQIRLEAFVMNMAGR